MNHTPDENGEFHSHRVLGSGPDADMRAPIESAIALLQRQLENPEFRGMVLIICTDEEHKGAVARAHEMVLTGSLGTMVRAVEEADMHLAEATREELEKRGLI